jgi:hypothetical protein
VIGEANGRKGILSEEEQALNEIPPTPKRYRHGLGRIDDPAWPCFPRQIKLALLHWVLYIYLPAARITTANLALSVWF